MITLSQLDELRKKLINLHPEFFNDKSLLKIPSIIQGLPIGTEPNERWQQDDLYFLYCLPESANDYVRQQLKGYWAQQSNPTSEYVKKAATYQSLLEGLGTMVYADISKLKALQSAQLQYVYLIVATVKNFLLLQELRIKSMSKNIDQNPSILINETQLIQQDILSAQDPMINCIGYAISRLVALQNYGPELLQEVRGDFERIETLRLGSLLKRTVCTNGIAMILQSTFKKMEKEFSDVVEGSSPSGVFFYLSCLPCASSPPKVAYKKLREMSNIVLDNSDTTAWAVLGLFLEAYHQVEDYPHIESMLEQCFKNALGIDLSVCDKEKTVIAEEKLEAYRQSKRKVGAPSLLEQYEMKKLGYTAMSNN